MGSLSNPKTWVPYTYTNNCSQRQICSLHCPQCCYNIIFPLPPPPPPPLLQFPAHQPSTSTSTLLIAVIGVLASALLLIIYYIIISKYCVNKVDSASPSSSSSSSNEEEDHIIDHTIHEPWVVAGKGLDESMIKSIAIFKYNMKGNGIIVQGTECSVCLSEFQDDESLKLLPNCTHPFHVNCIDTWLKSHSNCPLCRANIIQISPSNQSLETPSSCNMIQTSELGFQHIQDQPEASVNGNASKSIIRALSDLGRLDTIIEIRDHRIRRTVSMDNYSMTDVLRIEEIAANSKGKRLAMKASFSRQGRFCYDSHFMNISPGFECFDEKLQHYKRAASSGQKERSI